VTPHLGCHVSVNRVKIGFGGPKLPQVQNLVGGFVVFLSERTKIVTLRKFGG